MTIYRNLTYLEKHRYGEGFDLPNPKPKLRYIFIHHFIDSSSCIFTLDSLNNAPSFDIEAEVYLVMNESNESESIRKKLIAEKSLIDSWALDHRFPYPIYHLESFGLPPKKLTQGMAMKIGMDQALQRFKDADIENGWMVTIGPKVSLEIGFLKSLDQAIHQKPHANAIGFGFEIGSTNTNEEIIKKEVAQRYIIEGLRYASHPHAYYTLGDTFACRAKSYEKYGGINQRSRGATFSFLQKFISDQQFKEIPSIKNTLPSDTHFPQIFSKDKLPALFLFTEIRGFLSQLHEVYDNKPVKVGPALTQFLFDQQFEDKLQEMKKHTTSFHSFQKRFFAWFGLETIAKFLRIGNKFYEPLDMTEACQELFKLLPIHGSPQSLTGCLNLLRHWHKAKETFI